jgi:hypothetical protein
MSGTGTAIVDFGTTPVSNATEVVTGQAGILASSLVEAWISPVATADHTADEHTVEELGVMAGNIVPGTGFTIYLTAFGPNGSFGKWTVNWVWF